MIKNAPDRIQKRSLIQSTHGLDYNCPNKEQEVCNFTNFQIFPQNTGPGVLKKGKMGQNSDSN